MILIAYMKIKGVISLAACSVFLCITCEICIFKLFFIIYFFSFQYIQTDYTYLCIYHTCSYISYIFYFNLLIITINPLQTGIVALEYKDLKLQLCY